jgi:hypothetical protein
VLRKLLTAQELYLTQRRRERRVSKRTRKPHDEEKSERKKVGRTEGKKVAHSAKRKGKGKDAKRPPQNPQTRDAMKI